MDQGDSAIGIVEKFQKNVIVIHGSKFKDDCSDDYSYLLLSIIILHMEAGRCVSSSVFHIMKIADHSLCELECALCTLQMHTSEGSGATLVVTL